MFPISARPKFRPKPAVAGGGPAAAFLARTSGLDGTHTTAYTNLINGLVTDGVWSKLDALWIPATQDLATARLNLVSASFALVDVGGAPTFVADRGTTGQLDTQYTPSTAAGNLTQNSAHFSAWPNQTTNSSAGDMGTFSGPGFIFLFTQVAGSSWNIALNDTSNHTTSDTTATGKGFYAASRLGSSQWDYYFQSSVSGSEPQASAGLATASVYLGGVRGNGAGGKQMSAASIGGGLTSTEIGNLRARLQTYMTAVGN
jgi:hypothetical protein